MLGRLADPNPGRGAEPMVDRACFPNDPWMDQSRGENPRSEDWNILIKLLISIQILIRYVKLLD